MLFKLIRRKDPIELNHSLLQEKKAITVREIGGLVGATAFYKKQRQAKLISNLL